MKVGIMQPYAFPYIGYFQLMNHVDKWVFFDDTQYISKGWINRNRILHPDIKKEWQYFTIPVKKHPRTAKIYEIKTNDNLKWKSKFLGQLTSYKKKAPHYSETIEFVSSCLDFKYSTLSEWLENTLIRTCDYLGIHLEYSIFSQMNVDTKNIEHAGQWALEIADSMGADEYFNPPGGYDIFNENEFMERNIELKFLQSKLTPYVQRRGMFVPGMSIVDVMMWNEKDRISEMLKDHEIVTQAQLRSDTSDLQIHAE